MVHDHPRLSAPPLVEVVFELRARANRSFSLIPGLMANALAQDYPDATETELARVPLSEPPVEAGIVVTHQFKASGGKRLIQLGPGGISVNTLDYGGFDHFRAEVAAGLTTYYEHASVVSVHRLGLRYLNRIPSEKGFLSGFTVKVDWPPMPGGQVHAFAARMLIDYTDPPGRLGAVVAQPSAGPSLDLDFFHEPRGAMEPGQILDWVNRAHDRVYEAFMVLVHPALLEHWR